VDVRHHLLEGIEVVADAPQHEVDTRLQAEGRVGEEHHRAGVAGDDLAQLALGVRLRLPRLAAECAIDAEELEVHELALHRRFGRGGGLRLGLDGGRHDSRIVSPPAGYHARAMNRATANAPSSHGTARSYQQLLTKLLRHGAYAQLRKVVDKTMAADLGPVLP